MRLGFIGTGRMGQPMVRKLVEDVAVTRETAAALGATLGPLDPLITAAALS